VPAERKVEAAHLVERSPVDPDILGVHMEQPVAKLLQR